MNETQTLQSHKRSHSQVSLVQSKMKRSKLKELDQICSSPDNYFNKELNPILGKGNSGPRYKDNKIIQYSIVCKDKYEEVENSNRKNQRLKSEHNINYNNLKSKISLTNLFIDKKSNGNFQILSNTELDVIYNNIKTQMHNDKNPNKVTVK